MPTVPERLATGPVNDGTIAAHYFTPDRSGYEVVVDVPNALPQQSASSSTTRYKYHFLGCVVAEVTTDFSPAGASTPSLLSLIEDSQLALDWSQRLSQPMHEVNIRTNSQNIQLVFHDLEITELRETARKTSSPQLQTEAPLPASLGLDTAVSAPRKRDDLYTLVATAVCILPVAMFLMSLSQGESWQSALRLLFQTVIVGAGAGWIVYGSMQLINSRRTNIVLSRFVLTFLGVSIVLSILGVLIGTP